MASRGIVPFVSRSSLFNRGMAAQCPPLRALALSAAKQDPRIRARCERILEGMLREMPRLPKTGINEAEFDGLCRASDHEIRRVTMDQRRSAAFRLHARWLPWWRDETDDDVRAFGVRCAVLLTELYKRGARRPLTDMVA